MKRAPSTESAVRYVLDTSAVTAYLAHEPGSGRLESLRETAALPFVVITELYYVTCRKHDPLFADEIIQQVLGWHLPFLTADQPLSLSAGYLKARCNLGLADSYIAAFALAHQATLVTKDTDFRALQPDLKILWL